MNANILWETTLDPKVRVLKKVELTDKVIANNVFTTLMGDNVEDRRTWLNKNVSFTTSKEEEQVESLINVKK